MKFYLLHYCVLVLGLSAVSCKHQPQQPVLNNNPKDTLQNSSSDSVCFNSYILPVIISNCAKSGCHDPVTASNDLVLNSYNGVMKVVKPFDIDESKLIRYITETDPDKRMPPPPNAKLPSNFIDSLKKWINQGARNTVCNSLCDTNNVKFSIHVMPIINNYCLGCHSGNTPGGYISLENYQQVKLQVDNGKIQGAVNWKSGFYAMPKGGAKLSTCNIRKIEIWINNGALND